MATTAELESRYLAGSRASATQAATGGAPTGNQSNGVVFATGSGTPLTLADIAANLYARQNVPEVAFLGDSRIASGYGDSDTPYADPRPAPAIAAEHGLTKEAIYHIRKGRTWARETGAAL